MGKTENHNNKKINVINILLKILSKDFFFKTENYCRTCKTTNRIHPAYLIIGCDEEAVKLFFLWVD